MSFEFNTVYVIESLENERKTGKELFDDFIRYQEYQVNSFVSPKLFQPNTKADLEICFNQIKADLNSKQIFPILHFEMHGSEEKNGLILASGEIISWQELCVHLLEINIKSKFNLFLTLAVCHGGYLMEALLPWKAAPFYGFVGSFETLGNNDLLICYLEFYQELLCSLDLNKAFQKLKDTETSMPKDYKIFLIEEIFKNVYDKYILNLSSERIKERSEDAVKTTSIANTRKKKREFKRKFSTSLKKTKYSYFERDKATFFMYETFPQNKSRFLTDFNPFLHITV